MVTCWARFRSCGTRRHSQRRERFMMSQRFMLIAVTVAGLVTVFAVLLASQDGPRHSSGIAAESKSQMIQIVPGEYACCNPLNG